MMFRHDQPMQELSFQITSSCGSVHSAASLPTPALLLSNLLNCFGADSLAYRYFGGGALTG
jgi:hypothetical protein